jgi:hypothetical protein
VSAQLAQRMALAVDRPVVHGMQVLVSVWDVALV